MRKQEEREKRKEKSKTDSLFSSLTFLYALRLLPLHKWRLNVQNGSTTKSAIIQIWEHGRGARMNTVVNVRSSVNTAQALDWA
jgi:hypothetical protein